MSDLKLGININVDTTDTQAKIQAIIESLSKLSESSNDAKFQEDVKNTVNQLTVLNTVLLASSTAAKQTGDSAGKAGEDIKKMASKATIDTLKDLQKTFSDMEKYISNFTKSFVDEAREMGKYEAKLKAFSGSAEEAAKNLKAVKDYAATAQPFTTKELTQAGVELAKFGLDVKTVLPKISDFAAAIKEDVATVSNDFGRALSGTRGGLQALSTQYGLTKAKLIEYGAAVTQGGEIDKDALATKQAITRAMSEFAGSAADASTKYGASMAQLKNQTEEFRNEVGKELLPKLTELNNLILTTIKWFNSLAEPQKNSIANFLLFGTAISGAGVAIAGAGIKVIEFKKAMDLANLSMTAAVPIVGVVAVAIGALANTYIDFWRKAEEAKSEKIVKDFEELAKAVNAVRDAFPKAGNAVSAFNEIVKNGTAALVNDAQGMEKLKTVTEGLSATQKEFSRKKLEDTQNLTKAQSELQELEKQLKTFHGDDQLTKQTKEQLRLKKEEIAGIKEQIIQDKSSIEAVKEKLGVIKDITKEVQKGKEIKYSVTLEGAGESIVNISKQFSSGFATTEKALENFIENQNKLLNGGVVNYQQWNDKVTEYLNKYIKVHKLTAEQGEYLDIQQNNAKKKYLEEGEKAWEKYYNAEKALLASGAISQQQYNENIKKFLTDNEKNLSNHTLLKDKITKEYYDSVNNLEKKNTTEQNKNLKSSADEHKKLIQQKIDDIITLGTTEDISYKEEIERLNKLLETETLTEEQINSVKKARYSAEKAMMREDEAAAKQAAAEKLRIEKEFQRNLEDAGKEAYEISINRINDNVKEYEKAGISKVKIEEFYSKSVKKIQEDVLKDFKDKEDAKVTAARESSERIIDFDNKIKENKEKQDKLINDTSTSNSPLMSMEEALKGGGDPYQKKFKELQKLKDEEKKLEREKNEELEKQKKIQEDLKKIQDDKQKAEEVFNKELSKGVDSWQAQIDKVYSLTDAIKKATAEKEKYNSAGGGGSSDNPSGGSSENPSGNNQTKNTSNNTGGTTKDTSGLKNTFVDVMNMLLAGGKAQKTTTMSGGAGSGLEKGIIGSTTIINYNTTVDNNAGSSGARTTRAVRDINSTAMKFGNTRRV